MSTPAGQAAEQPNAFLLEQWDAIDGFMTYSRSMLAKQLTFRRDSAPFLNPAMAAVFDKEIDSAIAENAKVLHETLGALATAIGSKLLVSSPENRETYGCVKEIGFDKESMAYRVYVEDVKPNDSGQQPTDWLLHRAVQIIFRAEPTVVSTVRPLTPPQSRRLELPQNTWRPGL